MREPIHAIVNPNAAGGRTRRVFPRLQRHLHARGISCRSTATTGPGHALDLARAAVEAGAPSILVVGGDGTLHEVANGILEVEHPPPLAVLPVGTGNDFHRMMRASGSLAAVAGLLESGRPRSFEVGKVVWAGGERHFVNLLGIGVDVEVLRRRSRFGRLPGLLQYGTALFSAAATFQHPSIVLELHDDRGRSTIRAAEALLAVVTVGPSIGGGFMLSPGARPDDGLLDLFLVEDLGLLGVARHLPRVLRGTHATVPEIFMQPVRYARIESADGRPLHFELDGELMPEPSPWLEIEVQPGRLAVLDAPAPAKDAGMKRTPEPVE